MRILGIDLETYSDVDLTTSGVHAYAASAAFEILLLAYCYDDGPVEVVDLASGEGLPPQLLRDLVDPQVIKAAFNAAFERTCLTAWLKQEMPAEQWFCTMVQALMLGLPGSLGGVAEVLKLEQQKNTAGRFLISYFSKPCKPTRTNGGRLRNLPQHDPEKWQLFKDYCKQDVETERDVRKHLSPYQPYRDDLTAVFERLVWCLDQRINDRGIALDQELVRNAIALDRTYQARLEAEAIELTGLDNPNSVAQLKQWLYEAEGLDMTTLSKQILPVLLDQAEDETTKRVLTLRQEMSRTSTRKYEAMERMSCADGRARGLLQYYGARTGRWTGRQIQVQNLPQNHLRDLDLARQLLRDGHHETIELLYDVPDTLSQLIRTALIPSPGNEFIAVDFSAIEARVIAWLAGEQWRIDVFNSHGKIYEASASQMFKVPIEQITKGNPLRQKGKIAELALGFGGGAGALERMGALKMGLTADELPGLVKAWRGTNPNIVQYWQDCEQAAINCVAGETVQTLSHGIKFISQKPFLFIELPSGRRLAYAQPQVDRDPRFGRPQLTFMRYSQGRWCRGDTFGGRIVENCLAGDTRVLTDRGWVQLAGVRDTDLLWDGTQWVTHGGLVRRGTQQTVELDGVRLTPDHQVLTEGGWLNASACEGHHRHEVALPDRNRLRGIKRQEAAVEDPVRLRQGANHAGDRVPEGPAEVVRVPVEDADRSGQHDSRVLEASRICGLAVDERPLPAADTPRLGGLRRPGDTGLSGMGCELRSVLAGHGPDISQGAVAGSDRCERQLLSGELPVGDCEEPEPQPTQQPLHGDAVGPDDCRRSSGTGPDWSDHASVPAGSRMPARAFVRRPGRYEPVYDILNAGPRRRFVVMGQNGPFIVHNCVQAVARDCLAVALTRLAAAGCEIAFHVHDEAIIDVPIGKWEVKDIIEIVSRPIEWAPGLPLRADGFKAPYYMKGD